MGPQKWKRKRKHLDTLPDPNLLHLADNFAGSPQRLHHLLALLPPPDSIITLLEQVIEFISTIHILKELFLHLVLCKSAGGGLCQIRFRYHK